MELAEIAGLSLAAFCTSALTAVVGAGGGTLLILLMLHALPPAAAIPVHGTVQLASNMTRAWLLRRHMAWPIILRFAALMPVGVWLGLKLFQGLPPAAIEMLIGLFVLVSLGAGRLGRWRKTDLPLWAFVPVGLGAGALNMVVGVIGPVLGALVVRRDLSKEAMVGTLGLFGVLGNLLKIIGFSLIGFSFARYGPLILGMVPAAVAGAWTGRRMLARLDQRRFLAAFQIVLAALALKMVVVDGVLALAGR